MHQFWTESVVALEGVFEGARLSDVLRFSFTGGLLLVAGAFDLFLTGCTYIEA